MRILSLLFALVFISASPALSQSKNITETIKVYGNCGMCKSKIEETMAYTPGVKFGEWDEETKLLVVKFNSKKTTIEKIKTALADIGYDSDTHRASDKDYENLHVCCKYERPENN